MRRAAILIPLLFLAAAGNVLGQSDALTYQMPPQVRPAPTSAPSSPGVYLSPDNEWVLLR